MNGKRGSFAREGEWRHTLTFTISARRQFYRSTRLQPKSILKILYEHDDDDDDDEEEMCEKGNKYSVWVQTKILTRNRGGGGSGVGGNEQA